MISSSNLVRIGIGFDLHRLVSSPPEAKEKGIPIAGVFVPCHFSVEAHSDGDVVLHALTDAILGSLALGDLGQRYSEKDPKNKNRNSTEFVKEVACEIEKLGWRVQQIDAIIQLEEPKLSKYYEEMRRSLAHLVKTSFEWVSIKAKTMEQLGPIGEKKAIAAHVIVSVVPKLETNT